MTEGWKLTTNAVHDQGGVIFLQLWHTGRASHSSFHDSKPAVAPSAIKINEPDIHTPIGKRPHEVPRALATSEIPRVVADYRRAALRAMAEPAPVADWYSPSGGKGYTDFPAYAPS
jgi:N-ethylmaleimide reductase